MLILRHSTIGFLRAILLHWVDCIRVTHPLPKKHIAYLFLIDKIINSVEDVNSATPLRNSKSTDLHFTLSWSHYLKLMRIENPDERKFYEIEATENNWSLRELQRQFDSSLYERLVLSRDKEEVKALAHKGQIIEKLAELFDTSIPNISMHISNILKKRRITSKFSY